MMFLFVTLGPSPQAITCSLLTRRPCSCLMSLTHYTECHAENEMRPRDPVRCRSCGYRILYKKRTTRLIVFDAR
ncbi:DNA-directed RNA polymerases I, II, and III subunit RPABC4-like [Homarus americanus]|uniref:DNA-directed RNA polymerases I, II, and III subunit RPABC4-like n=1 Tax=Homarus americanus TaxID=6706 RepID=A0A8J5N954_HOMAM|nr:DNA-directed RNA polymerases I, II, and III subunit RPABC4-like [Homarus americanus]